jgi:capping protein beta
VVDSFDALLDLLRRLPPTNVEKNVSTLCDIRPDLADDLLGNVDQPLQLLKDEKSGKDFLGCDYNRDGDSFRYVHTEDEMTADGRSPWSNAYIPESPGAPTPSSKLRQLEVSLNSAFVTYKEMYFEGGVSSVYLWDLEEQQGRELAFAGVVLLKKSRSSSQYGVKRMRC